MKEWLWPSPTDPMMTEVTLVNERIMRLRITYTPCVISLVSVYASTGVSEFPEKEAFYTQLTIAGELVYQGGCLDRSG